MNTNFIKVFFKLLTLFLVLMAGLFLAIWVSEYALNHLK
jgi:uncharacterized protein HemY